MLLNREREEFGERFFQMAYLGRSLRRGDICPDRSMKEYISLLPQNLLLCPRQASCINSQEAYFSRGLVCLADS